MTAATLDRERLAAVLGLLGSDHPGEILAAARQAERLRRKAGMMWAEILLPGLPQPTGRRDLESVEDAIAFALDFETALTEWECRFLRTLRRQCTPISEKQMTILDQLIDKAKRAEARAA